MPETPISLLERLRLRPDEASWRRLVQLYAPWIQDWLRRQGLAPADVEDVAQEVMVVLVRELPHFTHDLRRGAFRRWLRTITLNRLRAFWRGRKRQLAPAPLEAILERLEDPESDLSRAWDREHNAHVVRRLLELLEADFEPATWQAFRLVVLEGKSSPEAAQVLGLSPVAVRVAKSRVLSRFRREADGLAD
jgi:RNA polymerase sigma-70 factor (ECF subfamily)